MSRQRDGRHGGSEGGVPVESTGHEEDRMSDPVGYELSPGRMLAFLVLSIFLAEAVVMVILHMVFSDLSPATEALLDSAILVLLVLPAVYVALFRPMSRTIEQLEAQKAALESSRQTIEQTESQRNNLEVLNQVLRHDIRNNLQVITSYLTILDEHVDDSGRDYLETINDSADEAVALTETAGSLADVMLQPHVENEPIELASVVEEEVAELRAVVDADVHVVDSIPNTEVRANSLLNSVFRNLLTNAVRHNDDDNPEITVTAEESDGTVRVRVADNGPGVPDDQKEGIFGRGEKGLESPGTGLGLYLVDTLVDSYGGDVWVEDNEPEGAVFVVELPSTDGAS